MRKLSIGSAAARPGEKISGFIDVAAGVDPATRIPVSVIAGRHNGPVLALIAGIHGSEPSPIVALQRVRAELEPRDLVGTVVLVHVANVPSFEHRTIYRGPWDQKNLNRVFPGRHDGTGSERIAHAITSQVIEQCDYLIDMHSGDGNEALRPYAYWNKLGIDDAVDATARGMAMAFGLDHIVIDRGRPRTRDASMFCSNTAHIRGKAAITTEAGELGLAAEEMVAVNARGAFRVMRYLDMLPGPKEMIERPRWIEPSEVLLSPRSGLWHPAVRSNQSVADGALLGTISDYFGETIAEVRSPLAGVMLYVVASPAISEGEPLGMVGSYLGG